MLSGKRFMTSRDKLLPDKRKFVTEREWNPIRENGIVIGNETYTFFSSKIIEKFSLSEKDKKIWEKYLDVQELSEAWEGGNGNMHFATGNSFFIWRKSRKFFTRFYNWVPR